MGNIPLDLKILRLLAVYGAQSKTAIYKKLHRYKAILQNLVLRDLEQEQYIKSEKHPANKKPATFYNITPQGQQYLQQRSTNESNRR